MNRIKATGIILAPRLIIGTMVSFFVLMTGCATAPRYDDRVRIGPGEQIVATSLGLNGYVSTDGCALLCDQYGGARLRCWHPAH